MARVLLWEVAQGSDGDTGGIEVDFAIHVEEIHQLLSSMVRVSLAFGHSEGRDDHVEERVRSQTTVSANGQSADEEGLTEDLEQGG